MKVQMIWNFVLCMGLFFFLHDKGHAQVKTREELMAEREMLKSEMKSKEAEDRKSKMQKLEAPKPSGVASVDELAGNSTDMLTSTREINVQVPEMYKRTIGETVEGVTDVTVKKPTMEELMALSASISKQIKAVSDGSDAVAGASGDIKKASPLQAPKASKSLNYSREVMALVGPELELNLKVVNNLIETLRSSNNH